MLYTEDNQFGTLFWKRDVIAFLSVILIGRMIKKCAYQSVQRYLNHSPFGLFRARLLRYYPIHIIIQ